MQLGRGPVQAAASGGVTERGLIAGPGAGGGRCPELCQGDLAGAASPAVLVQPVREPIRRPAGRAAGLPGLACGVAGLPGWAGLAGRGRMRVSGPRTPLHGTAA